jgi:hypothetical protein
MMAVLVASASYTAEAQGILFAQKRDTTKVRKPGKLIQVNRIDRKIDQNAFA